MVLGIPESDKRDLDTIKNDRLKDYSREKYGDADRLGDLLNLFEFRKDKEQIRKYTKLYNEDPGAQSLERACAATHRL